MKGFAVVLLCAFAAVQGRSADPHQKLASGTPSVHGQDPAVVHLRVAPSNMGGQLNSCAGSLIHNSWVLTSSSCLASSAYIWVRYGAPHVYQPALVTETSAVRRHPTADLALVSLNRHVEPTEHIRPMPIADAGESGAARLCGWGGDAANNTPGAHLNCLNVNFELIGDELHVAIESTRFDLGQPLVNPDGHQIGILTRSGSGTAFLRASLYKDWIRSETGINLN